MKLFDYFSENWQEVLNYSIEHIKLTAIAVGFAILIGVPLGILVSYIKKLNKPILSGANIIQAIPSMALLGFLIPLLGIGNVPSIVAVTLYSLLPIIKNTYIGIDNINPQTLEAAKGIGLTKFQVLTKNQIPMALPVIMGGVRISAVTAVGLMTMAAFIGAGGLGQLIFTGIRMVDNYQILGGAIPAAILALIVDYVIGIIEKLVTPVSLQKGSRDKKLKSRKKWKIILIFILCIILFATIFTSIRGNEKANDNGKTITIGSKFYTEQLVIGNLVADIIEDKTDINVETRFGLNGTKICVSAMESGDIDMYVEYEGTAYSEILKYDPIRDQEELYNTCKRELKEKYGFEVLDYMRFNDTYALSVSKQTAEKYNLKTISDLALVANKLTAGVEFEFLEREDGLPGITKEYNFEFKDVKALDGSPRYTAIANNEVDVIDAYATDGLLRKFDLVVLEDDKNFFPPYYAIPLINEETLEKYPELEHVLDDLSYGINNDIMTGLNYKVDVLGEDAADVAHEFLVENGYISK